MNIPVQILEHLKCSNCENLLSCGPVLLKLDGSHICGRCSKLEGKSAVPNKPYNELAEMCMFPCKYEALGCYEKISFSSMKQHEASCKFQPYICPIILPGCCNWRGSRNSILKHTRESHPEKILEHPCEMEHDVKTASLKTFLTTAFDVVFLVYVKVCLTTHTIYHSVRNIGNVNDGRVFKYEIHIGNNSGTLIKKGDVTSQDCLAMQEHTSIAVKINTLSEALDGLENTKFIIIIQHYMMCSICAKLKREDQIGVVDKISNIFYCKACAVHSCKKTSNIFLWKTTEDINDKKWCKECNVNIKECNILHHIGTKNDTDYSIRHLFRKYWFIYEDREDISFLQQNMCYLFVYQKRKNFLNDFFVQGRPNSANKSKCVLVLRNTTTKFASHYIMNETYRFNLGQYAWSFQLHDEKLKPYINSNKFEVGIDIYFNE